MIYGQLEGKNVSDGQCFYMCNDWGSDRLLSRVCVCHSEAKIMMKHCDEFFV